MYQFLYHVCCGGVMVISKTFEHLTVFVFNFCYTTWNILQVDIANHWDETGIDITGKTNNIKGVFMVWGHAPQRRNEKIIKFAIF